MTKDNRNDTVTAPFTALKTPKGSSIMHRGSQSFAEVDLENFEELGVRYSTESNWLRDFKAICATVQSEWPDATPRAVFSKVRSDADTIRRTPSYRVFFEKFSAPTLGVDMEVGRMNLKATREPDGLGVVSISVSPKALTRNALLFDPIFDPWNRKLLALDREAVKELQPFIRKRYQGEEIPVASEGYELDHALLVQIHFREGHAANFASVAKNLVGVCISREFNHLFLRLVRQVAARYDELLFR